MSINIKGKGLEVITVDQGDNNNAYFVNGMLSALSYFGKMYVAMNWDEFKDYGRNAIFNGKGAFLNSRPAQAFVRKFGNEAQQYIDEALEYLYSIEENTKVEKIMKIILKEGQEVLDKDGNIYLTEKGDTILEKNSELYAIYNATENVVYMYDEWFEKPVDSMPVSSEKEAMAVATKKWKIPLNKVKIEESLKENSMRDKEEIIAGFLRAGLFVGNTDDGEPLDNNYSISDYDKNSIKKATNIMNYFLQCLAEFELDYEDCIEDNHKDLDDLGIDLWMTMTGQGTTFMDWDNYADAMYESAKKTLKKYYVETVMEIGDGTLEIL